MSNSLTDDLIGMSLLLLSSSPIATGGGGAPHLPPSPLPPLSRPPLDRLALLEEHNAALAQRVYDLERVVPKEFEVLHYNVLSSDIGSNMLPWFCYGADLTKAERRELHRRFYRSGEANKRLANKGWPAWAEGVLSAERIAAVEAYDRRCFTWESRCERLWLAVSTHRVGCRVRSPDVITLAECDRYEEFWYNKFDSAGYQSIWRKRPRDVSRDGCAIAWRSSTFELVAHGGFDFGSRMGSSKPDR